MKEDITLIPTYYIRVIKINKVENYVFLDCVAFNVFYLFDRNVLAKTKKTSGILPKM